MDGKIHLKDILAIRYSFYKTVLLFVTRYCPLKCRHCAVEAGPDHTESMSPLEAESWIKGMKVAGGVELIVVSGGEPFARLDLISSIFRTANQLDLKTAAITSAFWADTPWRAKEVLDGLPPFTILEISADEFHQEYVPFDNIRNAAVAATEKGITVIIGFTTYKDPTFKQRFYDFLGADLCEAIEFIDNDLHYVGRAASNGLVSISRSIELPEGSCGLLCAPVVRYDGYVMACCHNEIIFNDQHVLWLGNLRHESFGEVRAKAEKNLLIQALRTIGPAGLLEEAIGYGFKWKSRPYRNNILCDLCRDIIFLSDFSEVFEKMTNNQEFRERITISRFLKHGEVMLT